MTRATENYRTPQPTDVTLHDKWRLVLKCATDSEISKADLATMLLIADHVNRLTGEAYPSIGRLALLAGITPRSAQRALKKLVNLGYLTAKRVSGRATRYGLMRLPAELPKETPDNNVGSPPTQTPGDSDTQRREPLTPKSHEPSPEACNLKRYKTSTAHTRSSGHWRITSEEANEANASAVARLIEAGICP